MKATPDPLDWLIGIERDRGVRNALASLSSRDVELLLLKYTEGWSYCRLAEHLSIAESARDATPSSARPTS